MMYKKAICFCDDKVAREILATDDVVRIKELGRLVSNYNDNIWNGKRQIIVYQGLIAKFAQNEELLHKLEQTGNAILAECAGSNYTEERILRLTKERNDERTIYQCPYI